MVLFLEVNKDLVYLLMLFLDFYYIEDEIYEFFYVWELRNYRVLLLIFLKLLVVVDWVFGVFFKFDLKIISKYV